MSKPHDNGGEKPEKSPEKSHDKSHDKPHDKAHEKTKETQTGDAKKAAEHKKPEPPVSKGKVHEALPGHCASWSCKAKSTRFNFCDEHYDHFKFGLIKKTGEPVSDYEKKIEHYTAYKAKQRAPRAA